MKALKGSFADLTRAVMGGGCDVVLHCSGKYAEMAEVADAAPVLDGEALDRLEDARASLHDPEPFDEAEALALVTEAAGTRIASLGPDPTVQA
jgi:beta-N-acetylhexosaminidase